MASVQKNPAANVLDRSKVNNVSSQPLFFVVENSNEKPRGGQRPFVHQHLKLHHAKWKRRENAKEMRASVNFPRERDMVDRTKHSEFVQQPAVEYLATSNINPSERSLEGPNQDISEDVQGVRLHETTKQHPSSLEIQGHPESVFQANPLTVLQEGNTDPFDTFSVRVSPQINALMAFTRDCYLPGIQADVHRPGEKVVHPEWAACVVFLEDEGLAYSHFARISAILAQSSKASLASAGFKAQALEYKAKSLALIRTRLEVSVQDPKAHHQMLLLQNTEVYERNGVAAVSHASILVSLLQNGTITGNLAFLFKILYHDTQRAAMTLTRPCFDLETWVPAQFENLNAAVTRRVPAALVGTLFPQLLDPSIAHDEYLGGIFEFMRFTSTLLALSKRDESFRDSASMFWGRYACVISMGRLINHYLNELSQLGKLSEYPDRYQSRITGLHSQMLGSLTALLWLRECARIDSVRITKDVTLFDANEQILQHIKKMLIESDRVARRTSTREYPNLRFWALYTGARYAWRWKTSQKDLPRAAHPTPASVHSNEISGWFNTKLTEQAQTMQLLSWADATHVLCSFLHLSVAPSDDRLWFEEHVLGSHSQVGHASDNL